jgi:hypothetical protein
MTCGALILSVCAVLTVKGDFCADWKVFEAPGVEPVFQQKDQAIAYAETRACSEVGDDRPKRCQAMRLAHLRLGGLACERPAIRMRSSPP